MTYKYVISNKNNYSRPLGLYSLLYLVIDQYPSYHPYLTHLSELCPLNLLITLRPMLLTINNKVRILPITVPIRSLMIFSCLLAINPHILSRDTKLI